MQDRLHVPSRGADLTHHGWENLVQPAGTVDLLFCLSRHAERADLWTIPSRKQARILSLLANACNQAARMQKDSPIPDGLTGQIPAPDCT